MGQMGFSHSGWLIQEKTHESRSSVYFVVSIPHGINEHDWPRCERLCWNLRTFASKYRKLPILEQVSVKFRARQPIPLLRFVQIKIRGG